MGPPLEQLSTLSMVVSSVDKEVRILKQQVVVSTISNGSTSLACQLRMVLDVRTNPVVCHMEALVMFQGTGSSSGMARLPANLQAIKQHMTFMHVMITRDACAISTVPVQLIALKQRARLNHQLLPHLLLQMTATTRANRMTILLLHRLIPGKHGRHLRKFAMSLTTIKKIVTHVRCT